MTIEELLKEIKDQLESGMYRDTPVKIELDTPVSPIQRDTKSVYLDPSRGFIISTINRR
jgi:hypothetical protein